MFRMDENKLIEHAHRIGFENGKRFGEDQISEARDRIRDLENAMLAIMAVVVLPYDERSHEDVRLIVTSVLSMEGSDANEG